MVAALFGSLAGALGFLLIAYSLPGFFPEDSFSVLASTVMCGLANGLLSAAVKIQNLQAIRLFALAAMLANTVVLLVCDLACDGFFIDGLAVLFGGALLLAMAVTLARSLTPAEV